jgi:hypothetical protein
MYVGGISLLFIIMVIHVMYVGGISLLFIIMVIHY